MADTVCYIKLNRNIEVTASEVLLKDVASVRCADKAIAAKVKSIKICKFKEKEKQNRKKEENRCVISVLKLIELIEDYCPGVVVESLGESEVLVEHVNVNAHKRLQLILKIIFVSIICFCGTAFTIMAYHNDIAISDVFAQIHRIVMGNEPEGLSVLEVAYSAGLALGIIVFFNHVGGRRLTKDPTPIEVEMRIYETDVNNTLVDTAEREGKIIDVD